MDMPLPNKELIEKINEEFSRNNNEFYLDFLADDIRWNIIGQSTIIGKSNFLKAMKMEELESFPVITIKNIIAEGEYVVVESIGKATTKTGKSYKPAYCDIYRIKNGKIHEMTTYFVDTAVRKEK